MTHKDYKNLCELTIPVVRSVGEFIRNEIEQIVESDIVTKKLNSLVSYVDKSAEEKLVSALSVIFPGSGFVTEEDTVDQIKKQGTWIIDPLDGTTNFLHRIPHYAVSVALMVDKEIVTAVVLNAATDQCYYAWKGGGAYLDGQVIKVSETADLRSSIISTGFPYRKDDVKPLIGMLTDLMRQARGIRRMGAAALDLVYVASGRFDCYYEANINVWDIAAGILIVQEAGGQVDDYSDGDDIIFGGTIMASNGLIHKEVLTLLHHHFS